jgi:hypothetical protein
LAAVENLLEAVVLGHGTAERQLTPLLGDALDHPPELDLGLEQLVTLAAVLARLARETDVRIYRQ